jgi:ABC-type multidrug transport system fused ATPase/permease subunit
VEAGPASAEPSLSKAAWALLLRSERREALVVLIVAVLSAVTSAIGVGSILPFLSVLIEPDIVEDNQVFSSLYAYFGFESRYVFLTALGLGSIVFMIVANTVQMASTYLSVRFSHRLSHSLEMDLFSGYLEEPYEYFLDKHSGHLATNVLSEAFEAAQSFFMPALEFFVSAATVCAIVSLLIWVNPQVTLFALLVIGGSYGILHAVTRRYIRDIGQRRAAANRARYKIARETFGGIKDVKVSGTEAGFAEQLRKPSMDMARSRIWLAVIAQLPRQIVYVIAFGGMIVLCLSTLDPAAVQTGGETTSLLPEIGVFALAAQRLFPSIQGLFGAFSSMRFGEAALRRITADLSQRRLTTSTLEESRQKLSLNHGICFRSVSYSYPGSPKLELNNINLTIIAGEKIGIVGPTGAGKTTLSDIALGLLAPSKGHLIVDGLRITDSNRRAWRQSSAYVPQDIFLLDASVAENIAFGEARESIDQERVIEAARIAQLKDFVEGKLPHQYDTTVGERGVRLSGGQRQRLGIARALYRGASLIIFDEATSSLDNVTEKELMRALDQLPNEQTALIVAHRLSTVRRCDKIVFLQEGSLIAEGKWDELVRSCKPFADLVAASNLEHE